MAKLKTNEQFIKECIEIHGNKYDYSETCGAEMDADINAAINILHLGVYSPHDKIS